MISYSGGILPIDWEPEEREGRDWLSPPEEYVWIFKYSEDNPLPDGNWTLNVTSLKAGTNHVWYSGADNGTHLQHIGAPLSLTRNQLI